MSEKDLLVTNIAGTDDMELEKFNMELAAICGEYLVKHYPGYLWRVNADIRGGIVNVLCGDVSYEQGCTIFCKNLSDHVQTEKELRKAGGEILERANFHRGRMREDEVINAKRNVRGDVIMGN